MPYKLVTISISFKCDEKSNGAANFQNRLRDFNEALKEDFGPVEEFRGQVDVADVDVATEGRPVQTPAPRTPVPCEAEDGPDPREKRPLPQRIERDRSPNDQRPI